MIKQYNFKRTFFKKIKRTIIAKHSLVSLIISQLNNKTASQIFTKYGPIAFLPISNSKKTSIVFSVDINK